jgi:hypothetical protein
MSDPEEGFFWAAGFCALCALFLFYCWVKTWGM